MSHEIRTPMNAIIGMTSIGKTATDNVRKDYSFTKIEDASNHLLGVINDILDMSKIEANKLELSPVEFNFEKMLQRVVNVINFRVDE
jgi:signal transduction histidine kinase